jgi:hypothetical protein
VVCGKQSTTIGVPEMLPNTEDEEEYVMISPDTQYAIEAITVTNSQCPLNSVTLSEIGGASEAETNLTINSNDTMVAVTFPNITTSSKTYEFKIKIEANGGASASTKSAKVKYIDCENDLPIQNAKAKILNITFEVGELYSYSKDVSKEFESLKECPIKRYKIDRIIIVQANETISEKETYAEIDKTGKLKINYF